MSASVGRPSPSMSQDREMVLSGLETLAGWTGGQTARVTGSGDAAFKSLSSVLAGYYRLGVRPEPGDLDGKSRRIAVKLTRPGVSIRAHRRVMVAPPRTTATPAAPAAALTAALTAATPATGLAVRATTYILHEDQTSGKWRVLVAGDVGGGAADQATMRVALYDANGKAANAGEQDVELSAAGTGRLSASMTVPQHGAYALRVAVRDAEGRLGSLERNVDVRWKKIGTVETTGLALFSLGSTSGSAPEAVLDTVARTEKLVAQLAFMAPAAGAAEPSVVIEVTRDGTTSPLLRLPVRAGRMGSAPRRLAQETIPVSLLPAGRYTIAAVVSPGTPPLTRTVTVADVIPALESSASTAAAPGASASSAPGAAAPGGALAAATAVVSPLSLARPARFEASSVLAPARVSPVLAQLAGRVATPEARDSLAALKDGEWPVDATQGPLAGTPLAAHFVAGLGRLQQGDLEGAANAFRSALRAAPDFAPAMAYLGACYAAGGKDKEAASAWQTALLRDREASWLPRLAIEAWLRAERPAAAQALIKQARQRFPDDPAFVQLQAQATLAEGRASEGLEIVESVAQPDEPLLLLSLATLYAAAKNGASVWDETRDRAAFKKWRDAYAAANGASLTLVDAWQAELAALK